MAMGRVVALRRGGGEDFNKFRGLSPCEVTSRKGPVLQVHPTPPNLSARSSDLAWSLTDAKARGPSGRASKRR
jgi:hypothetical protein